MDFISAVAIRLGLLRPYQASITFPKVSRL